MNERKYYIHVNKTQKGPLTEDELKKENISGDTYIWYHGLEDWKKARELPELNELLHPSPPDFKHGGPPPFLPPPKSNRLIFWIVGATAFIFILAVLFSNSEKKGQDASAQTETENNLPEYNSGSYVADKNKQARKQVPRLVSVRVDGFKQRFLGGIKNLELSVKNSSAYTLDSVLVEVSILRSNDQVFETYVLNSKRLSARDSLLIEGKKSSSGKKVNARIKAVYCKELQLCYEAGRKNTASDDPYLCTKK